MTGIYVYPKRGTASKWKLVVNYDDHDYKEANHVSGDPKDNVVLYDNCDDFKLQIEQLLEDKIELNLARREDRITPLPELKEKFKDEPVLRSFRLEVSSIELNRINLNEPDPVKRKENINNFYKKQVDDLVQFLSHEAGQNCFKPPRPDFKVSVVKAEIHYDQSKPHLHLHLSNLYEVYNEKLQRTVLRNNSKINDWLSLQMKKQHELKLVQDTGKLSKTGRKIYNYKNPNTFFFDHVFTSKDNKLENKNYDQTHCILYKDLFPRTYNSAVYKELNLESDAHYFNWRKDKEFAFENTEIILRDKLQMREAFINNDVEKQRILHDITEYCLYQTLALQVVKEQKQELTNEQFKDAIEDLFKQQMANGFKQIRRKMIEPEFIKRDFQKIELQQIYPHLKHIEDTLNLDLFLHNELIRENKLCNEFSNELQRKYNGNFMELKENNVQNLTISDSSNHLFQFYEMLLPSTEKGKKLNKLLVNKFDTNHRMILQHDTETNESKAISINTFIQDNNLTFENNLPIVDDILEQIYLEWNLDLTYSNELENPNLSLNFNNYNIQEYTPKLHRSRDIKKDVGPVISYTPNPNKINQYDKFKLLLERAENLTDKKKEELLKEKRKELGLSLTD